MTRKGRADKTKPKKSKKMKGIAQFCVHDTFEQILLTMEEDLAPEIKKRDSLNCMQEKKLSHIQFGRILTLTVTLMSVLVEKQKGSMKPAFCLCAHAQKQF